MKLPEEMPHLPPRVRQVAELFLEGLSEKQVAYRLGISRHTVHDYAKVLYRSLGVESRGEFFCRVVRACIRPDPLPSSELAAALRVINRSMAQAAKSLSEARRLARLLQERVGEESRCRGGELSP
jgi:DNA-binding CsgD family transcriptional regulator